MDAYTKFIWFYPTVIKFDVFNVFHQFQVFVERQFSRKIKYVQTNWGGEYHKLNSFFKTIGIHHHLICPHIHEQNDIVERHHRHIVKTSLTLLGHCKTPLKLWNYAFETSIYLINCMSTPVLRNKSPFECLFHQPPNYAFLCVFGCLCFPFLRPYNVHKLDYRSTPCMFLGYSSSHLGYRYLDLSSNCIYISHHVQFHEQSFPFLDSAYNVASTRTTSLVILFSHLPSLTTFPAPNSLAPQTFPTDPSVPLPPLASMSLDHFADSGSTAPDLSTSDSPSIVVSPTSPSGSTCPPQLSTLSPPSLDLCVDLFSYSFSQQT